MNWLQLAATIGGVALGIGIIELRRQWYYRRYQRDFERHIQQLNNGDNDNA